MTKGTSATWQYRLLKTFKRRASLSILNKTEVLLMNWTSIFTFAPGMVQMRFTVAWILPT